MEVRTSTLSGYARFWFLAKLRRWRRGTLRYAEEQAQIEGWLALIGAGARHSPAVALEIAECARLIKGYGDTLKRGLQNYRTIEALVIQPLMAEGDAARTADAIASARVAALQDPEGETLARCIADIRRHPVALAAE
jgi:indolepyruvate ferredoxin oxidoreductase beta subunit